MIIGPFIYTVARAALLSLLAVGIAGCSSPLVQTGLELPIAAQWPQDSQRTIATATAISGLYWQDFFQDPQLQQLIETALEHNRDMRTAVLRVEEARAAYGIQRADLFPGAGVGGQFARSRIPGDLNGTGDSRVAGQHEAYVGLASWELDLWGRVRSLKDAALEQYLASKEVQLAVRNSLIAEVANAWLGLQELDERVALALATIESRENSYHIFQRRNQLGATSTLELKQVETLLLQARVLGAQLQQQRAAQLQALQLLLGNGQPLAQSSQGMASAEGFVRVAPGLPADLLLNRPDIIAAEHRLQAARANIHAARAAFFPRIALTGSWGTASAELDGLFDSGSRAWSFVPSISLPVFDGGRRRAGLELAQVRSELAVADYEKSIQTAFREVADALSAIEWLAEQNRLQAESVAAQAERARLAELRYDHGASTYLEVLDARRELLNSQQQQVQVRRLLLSSHVALYSALGGDAAAYSTSIH